MPINKNELTKEVMAKAMQCKTAEELKELAKSEGYDITLEEDEAYLTEMDDFELDAEQLKAVAGGLYNKTNDYANKCPYYGHR